VNDGTPYACDLRQQHQRADGLLSTTTIFATIATIVVLDPTGKVIAKLGD
jgi:hypothetical protein